VKPERFSTWEILQGARVPCKISYSVVFEYLPGMAPGCFTVIYFSGVVDEQDAEAAKAFFRGPPFFLTTASAPPTCRIR
jgi:hypothetical protein